MARPDSAEAADAVGGAIACRHHPSAVLPAPRPLQRRVTSAGFSFAVRRLLGLPYADTQCGAKVLRRDVIDDVLPALTTRDLLFDVRRGGVAQHAAGHPDLVFDLEAFSAAMPRGGIPCAAASRLTSSIQAGNPEGSLQVAACVTLAAMTSVAANKICHTAFDIGRPRIKLSAQE